MQPPNARLNSLRRRILALLVIPALGAFVGCGTEMEQVVTAKLEVSDAGDYVVDGVIVAKDDLQHVLRSKRPESGKLMLHVVASPKAPFQAVGFVMQAAQYAGAEVGFVGNERF